RAPERDEQIERQGFQWDDRSRAPHPPRCKVDNQIVDLVPRGIGGEVPSIRSPRLGRHGGALCWAISCPRWADVTPERAPPPFPAHRSTHPGDDPGGCATNPRSLVQRRHSRGAVTGVQLSEQRVVYLGNGGVDRGVDAVLPDALLSGGRGFVLADAARCRLDATIELGRAGRGTQVEVAEADLDAARRGRTCPRYGGAEEADREKRKEAKVVIRFGC